MSAEPGASRESVDLRREAARALGLLAVLVLACTAVFGPPWAKRGLWWGGVRTHAEFQRLNDASAGYLQRAGVAEEVRLAVDGADELVITTLYRAPGTGRTGLQQVEAGFRPPGLEIVDARNRPIPWKARRSYLGEMWVLTLPADLEDRMVRERFLAGKGQMSQRRGRDWVYTTRHLHGDAMDHAYTVILPAGATLLGASPTPTSSGQREGCRALTWSGRLEYMAYFDCRVTYRLPAR